jgi:LacI family transcriptional regulator
MPAGSNERPKRNRKRSQQVRVADIAEAVGVSGATVSRALARTGAVSEPLQRQIEAAARELGYVPNGAARALASRKSRAIGAIIPTLENLSFASGAEAMQRCVIEAGYSFLVASTGYDPAREFAQVRAFAAHGVDGIMLVGGARDAAVTDFLHAQKIPYVITWTLADAPTPSVGFDNHEAARRLTLHLLDLGHRQIGVVAGRTYRNDRAASRVAGIRKALAERGLALPQEHLLERPYRIAEGQLALRALIGTDHPPTAIICGNDQLAFGALIECGRQGIAVPQQLSVAGFDDLEFASQIVPSLTTMHVPAEEIGRRAAEYLLARVAGRSAPITTEVMTNLIIRESTAPPPLRRRPRRALEIPRDAPGRRS